MLEIDLFFVVAMIDLRLIDALACDKVQNLTIHLVIERKLGTLNSIVSDMGLM